MELKIIAPVDPLVERPGGTRTYVMNLISSLAKSGMDFSLIGMDFEEGNGSPSFEFVPAVVAPRVSSVRFLRGLMKVAKKSRFSEETIIHAQRPDYLFPFIFHRLPCKMLCTLHGQVLRSVKDRKGHFYSVPYNLLESYSLKEVDHIVAVDEGTLNLYINKYPFLSKRASLIPIGIDLEEWKPKDRNASREKYGYSNQEKNMLYVGRLEREKRVDLLIKSLPLIGRSIDDCSLSIVGDGTQRKELEALSDGIAPGAVRFVGTQPQEAVRELMEASDVFCLASSFESGPLVVLESLASGTPVVSTDVGRVREFMPDSSTGRIVSQDKEAIAEAVVNLLQIERGEISPQCMARAGDFGFQKTFEETLKVYEDLSQATE